jgi:hypothetical protein
LLTQGATFNILVDVGGKTRPPIIALDQFFHLEAARMACCGMIMELVEEVVVSSRGNISMIFVIQDRIHNFPVQQRRLHRWKT